MEEKSAAYTNSGIHRIQRPPPPNKKALPTYGHPAQNPGPRFWDPRKKQRPYIGTPGRYILHDVKQERRNAGSHSAESYCVVAVAGPNEGGLGTKECSTGAENGTENADEGDEKFHTC